MPTDPIKNQPWYVPCAFVDQNGNLMSNWANPAAEVWVAGEIVAGGVPVEDLDGSNTPIGMGTLLLTSEQMNGDLIHVKMTCTNSGSTACVVFVYTDPGFVQGTRPTTSLGRLYYMFQYLFGGGTLPRGSGIQTVLNDDGSTLTTIFTSGTDTSFSTAKSNP